MLLSDARVKARLKQDYVLCAESLRPAPRVTIDFGDGKVLTRTLKGNVAFYLCRPGGEVLDVIPGVYTPTDFLAQLDEDRSLPGLTDEQVRDWHRNRTQALLAAEEASVTFGKMVVESPLLKALSVPAHPSQASTDSTLSQDYLAYTATIQDISALPMSAPQARRRSAQVDPDPVQADSRQNRKTLRPAVHLLLSECFPGQGLPTPKQCSATIFKDILKVPLDDPYLGLGKPGIPGTDH